MLRFTIYSIPDLSNGAEKWRREIGSGDQPLIIHRNLVISKKRAIQGKTSSTSPKHSLNSPLTLNYRSMKSRGE